MEYVQQKYVKQNTIEKREYQDNLVQEGVKSSSVLVLPTGLGKTIISLRITARRLQEHKNSISLLLAPTKPLVEQHYETYKELLDIPESEILELTGEIRPEKREQMWDSSLSVIIATPEVIQNDLINDRITLENVSHLTFDECHRAKGEYPYTYIADVYENQATKPLITGLSASPGDDKQAILKICQNLNVTSIEILTEEDPSVEKYVHDVSVKTRFIDIDDTILKARDILQEVYQDRLEKLKENGYINSKAKTVSQKQLQRSRAKINKGMQNNSSEAYKAMSVWSEAMKINRAIELLETQGVQSFMDYYEQTLKKELNEDDTSKATKRLVANDKFNKALQLIRDYNGEYEKITQLKTELVDITKINNGKALVFTKSRDTVETLVDKFSDKFSVARLVGQSDKENSKGMTQKEQKEVVDMFSRGEYEVLIATQIGEEGLDISSVDSVIFYEPATKGIEQVQRMGRTGRSKQGEVIILIAKDTRDVGMYYKSKNSVENMKSNVKELQEISDVQEEINSELSENKKLTQFSSENNNENDITVYADSRETSSSVVRKLDRDGEINVTIESLTVGDYVVGPETVIERKSIQDLYDTITGERDLFEQIINMKQSYDNALLILEGEISEMFAKNMSENAIRGIFSSVAIDYQLPIIFSRSEKETAEYIKMNAKKLQEENDTTINPHGNKSTQSVEEQKKYIVSSIADVGPKTADNLIEHFDSVLSVFNASENELKSVDGVGEKTAEQIYTILRAE